MKPLKSKICVTIDADILTELQLCAERDERSLSQFINVVLKQYLKGREKSD